MLSPKATPRACGRRFPLDPLRQQFWISKGGVVPSNCELARLVGVHVRQVQRWAVEGLTERYADLIACRLGVHASWIWHDWWDDEEDIRYSPTLEGRQALRTMAGTS